MVIVAEAGMATLTSALKLGLLDADGPADLTSVVVPLGF